MNTWVSECLNKRVASRKLPLSPACFQSLAFLSRCQFETRSYTKEPLWLAIRSIRHSLGSIASRTHCACMRFGMVASSEWRSCHSSELEALFPRSSTFCIEGEFITPSLHSRELRIYCLEITTKGIQRASGWFRKGQTVVFDKIPNLTAASDCNPLPCDDNPTFGR